MECSSYLQYQKKLKWQNNFSLISKAEKDQQKRKLISLCHKLSYFLTQVNLIHFNKYTYYKNSLYLLIFDIFEQFILLLNNSHGIMIFTCPYVKTGPKGYDEIHSSHFKQNASIPEY